MRPNQIVQFLASNGDIPGKVIGAIAIFDEFSFVDIPKDLADQVVEKTDGGRIGRTPVHVELKRDSAEMPALERSEPSESRAFVEKKSYAPRSYADRKPSEPRTYSDRRPSEPRTYGERKPSEHRTYGDRKPSEPRTYGDRKPSEPRTYSDRKPAESGSYGEKKKYVPKAFGDKKRTYADKKKPEFTDKPRERKKRTE